ncbi:transporter [Dyadobacter chenwenxiniae]|uniref:Transporter n=1 Tax=Dyadobacter chenwenxiniae TaxID=2906456 RepID=A0A9X1TCS2_9BACT|nr:transporter [Dyadobacter chenwenxiniae]MCF0060417.1 transporter [Dyadobacter chenwenxiniae]UON86148.1 transporter [Dyadobacter chenwenxiniae]
MKIKYIAFIALFLAGRASVACDICGCANSGSYFGLMPQSHKSVIGLRYQRLHFVTHGDSKVLKTEEHFHVGELYARLFPIKRVQVMAFVPYRIDRQVTSADVKKQNGLGDITVLANYNILNTFMDKETSGKFNHTLMVGGGVKLPTGQFKFDENNTLEVANANFQLGTGSTDLIVNAFYTINKEQWGLATNISRKFNTTNSQGYRFGDQVFGTVELYRSFNLGNISLTPSIGVYGEHADQGKQHGQVLDITGGRLLNATAGVTFFSDQWTVGINAQKPVAQKSASGHVLARERLMLQVGFLF